MHGNLKHGDAKPKTGMYRVWQAMKERCGNPKKKSYRWYGARGIGVCRRWAESYEAFREDMGPRPPGYTIERMDGDGDYEPGNCKWASWKEQRANQKARERMDPEERRKRLRRRQAIARKRSIKRDPAKWRPKFAMRAMRRRERLRGGAPVDEKRREIARKAAQARWRRKKIEALARLEIL